MENVLLGIFIPFLGTAFGSAAVFFMRKKENLLLKKFLLGFAGGIMVAASIWSLLIPALEQSKTMQTFEFLPAASGIVFGFVLLFILQMINNYFDGKKMQTHEIVQSKKSMMVFSITLHNIPEGLAVGVAMAGAYFGNSLLSISSALMLSIGIAIQNIPEGAIVSMPSKTLGKSKIKAFLSGVFSGIVEPISAIIAFFVTGFVSSVLPYVLAFAAGSMLFVVVEEIIPESQLGEGKNLSTFGFMAGFVLMLILDVTLG